MTTTLVRHVVVEKGIVITDNGGDAIVPWWSFTKTVIAAAALVLVQGGRLALDIPIAGKPYTLRQLLQHRAGVTNYGGLPDYQRAVARRETAWPVNDLLARTDAGRLIFPPGAGWAYSNIGYFFVRQLIEQTTGEDLDSVLRRLVLVPLDLQGTRLARHGDLGDYDPGWVYHGLLVGPPREAALLLDCLMRGDLLPPADMATMLQAHPVGGPIPGRPWQSPGYGLGLMTGSVTGGGLIAGHTGSGPGSVIAVYHLLSSSPARTVAAFASGDDQGLVERTCIGEA